MSDGTAFLLTELAKAKAENVRLNRRLKFQKERADLWRSRVITQRYVSLVCGCGRTVRGRARRVEL